jgi:hypothetical protein
MNSASFQSIETQPSSGAFIGLPTDIARVRTYFVMASRLAPHRHGVPGCFLTGPPGCGKARLVQSVALEMGVPVVELDPVDYLPALGGAVPRRMEDAVAEFCNQLPAVPQNQWLGVILLRNIDRLARAGDVGSLLQANLASLIRRRSFTSYHSGQLVTLNPSSQISFILTSSLPELQPTRGLGFAESAQGASELLTIESAPTEAQLVNYGFAPTLLDAFSVRHHLPRLSEDQLTLLLTRSDSELTMPITLASEALGIRFDFSGEAISSMSQEAYARGRNGHSVNSLLYELLPIIVQARDDHGFSPQKTCLARIESYHATPSGPVITARFESMPARRRSEISGLAGKPVLHPGAVTLRRAKRGAASPTEARMARESDIKPWISQ